MEKSWLAAASGKFGRLLQNRTICRYTRFCSSASIRGKRAISEFLCLQSEFPLPRLRAWDNPSVRTPTPQAPHGARGAATGSDGASHGSEQVSTLGLAGKNRGPERPPLWPLPFLACLMREGDTSSHSEDAACGAGVSPAVVGASRSRCRR